MSQTYNDPAKQKSREKLEQFIRSHLAFKRPKDIRVVCFPGAETEGEEALEVREVYDKLGIPRQNITGLEQDAERAARLRQANLGIKVEETDAYTFFSTSAKQFDIVSLDYCGQQTAEEILTIYMITLRRALRDTAAVCTVYSGKREATTTKLLMGIAPRPEINAQIRKFTETDRDMHLKEVKQFIAERQKRLAQAIADKEVDLSELREGITANTLDMLIQQRGINLSIYSTGVLKRLILSSTNLREMLQTNGHIKCDDLPEAAASHLEKLLYLRYGVAHTIPSLERYSYTSNKNYLMMMDLFLVQRPSKEFARIDEIITYDRKAAQVKLNPTGLGRITFLRKLIALSADPEPRELINALQASISELPPRIDLGSSYVRRPSISVTDVIALAESTSLEEIFSVYQPQRKQLTREEALSLADKGVSSEDMEKYFGLAVMRLAGWKAHRTRAYKRPAA